MSKWQNTNPETEIFKNIVFNLPKRSALNTIPFFAAIALNIPIASSLVKMSPVSMAITSELYGYISKYVPLPFENVIYRQSIINTTILSASGSRNFPNSETVPVFLAMCPSIKSVVHKRINKTAAKIVKVILSSNFSHNTIARI